MAKNKFSVSKMFVRELKMPFVQQKIPLKVLISLLSFGMLNAPLCIFILQKVHMKAVLCLFASTILSLHISVYFLFCFSLIHSTTFCCTYFPLFFSFYYIHNLFYISFVIFIYMKNIFCLVPRNSFELFLLFLLLFVLDRIHFLYHFSVNDSKKIDFSLVTV